MFPKLSNAYPVIVCENEVTKFAAGGVATHLQLHFTGIGSVSETH